MTLSAAQAPARARALTGAAALPAALLGLSAAPVLAANGGYYPTSWGWSASALAWGAVVVAALSGRTRPSRYELAFLGGLAGFTAWLVVSMAWTETQTGTPLEIERTLVYVAAALAALAVVRREDVRVLLGGVCAGTTAVCAYGLATRVFPDRFVTDTSVVEQRLASPVGYWNGLGLVAAMGVLLALAFAARAESRLARAGAGVAVPVLLGTLYFTFSRGSWGALGVAVVVMLATDRRRLQLALTALPLAALGAVVVWEGSRRTALTHTNATLAAATHQGHRLAEIVLVAAVLGGLAALAAQACERRWSLPERVYRVAPWVTAVAVVVALAAGFAKEGSPWSLARRAYHSWTSNLSSSTNLNTRLFSFSNHGRITSWKVALHAFRSHPIGGIGPGGFVYYWNAHRPVAAIVQDAHSLYVETLAETGIVGLVLLVAALVAPLLAFRRARGEPLAAAALAAYVAYLLAAAVDWDWELSGVTLAALLCGAAVLAAGRRPAETSGRYRLLPLVLGTTVALAALYGLLGNLALSRTTSAFASGDLQTAAARVRTAARWSPWSAEPKRLLGEAELDLGRLPEARSALRSAISKDPLDEQLWLDLAQASTGQARAAALAQAHRLNPRDPDVATLRQELGSGG